MAEVKDYPPYLDYPKERKKQTNADRIRQMSDEELAENLSELFGECAFVHIPHREGTKPPCAKYDFDCRKCWLDWLKQEVCDD